MICALGGHGYLSFLVMGNWKILKYSATSYLDLVHETASRVEIKESDFISAMDWFSRVNVSIWNHGGYCTQADFLVKIKA